MLKWVVLERPPEFRKRFEGSDPRAATCRGKLQSKRSKLNMEINKELMLRSGAENLFRATTNKKMKETVALELSFVNSNLQLLKEQLAELNSSVELYQNGNRDTEIPMIPLGLKETKEIDFREPFKDFIAEHYSEDGADYEDAMAEFMDIRQAMRTPARDATGVTLLFEHFNQLYFVERRFFPPDRSLGIYFEWYDSLTGVPSCQRTVAFEKASVLFNIAALYTQIGTRQDRSKQRGLDSAVDNFLRAAGAFQYILENFTNAPSMDLSPDTLEMLVHLMCAQARECLFEKAELALTSAASVATGVKKASSEEGTEGEEEDESSPEATPRTGSIEECLLLGQEAAHVSEVYRKVHGIISQSPVHDYVPFSWVSLTQVKREHYRALSHFFVAVGLLDHQNDELTERANEILQFLHEPDEDTDNDEGSVRAGVNMTEIRVPNTVEERRYLGKAHLREALLLHEEALRVNRMCRELRKKDALQSVLRATHDRSLEKYASVDEEDDFQEVLDPPSVQPATQYQLSLAFPDLSQHKVHDLFADLGPVAVFNARNYWSVPREVRLRKRDRQGFGFSVRGDAPVIIAGVDRGSLAENGGMKEGDFIVAINDVDAKWSPHDEVVNLIKASGHDLRLKIVTPMPAPEVAHRTKQKSRSLSSDGASSGSQRGHNGHNGHNGHHVVDIRGHSISPNSTASSRSSSGVQQTTSSSASSRTLHHRHLFDDGASSGSGGDGSASSRKKSQANGGVGWPSTLFRKSQNRTSRADT